jgi:hypothetical protein
VGNLEEKRSLGRPRRRFVDNIKMYERDRMGCSCEHVNEHLGSIKFWQVFE